MNKQLNKKQILMFLKKYGYILALSVILLVTAITMAVIVSNKEKPVEETGGGTISFYTPVLNATVAKSYSDTSLAYNSTLKQWEAHKALTFTVPESSDVFAVLDGTIKDVYSNYLEGTVVVVEHGNNLTTVYGSLADKVNVAKGDVVKKGDVLGKAAATAHAELNLGNHLRFEVRKDGALVDPATYLNLGNK